MGRDIYIIGQGGEHDRQAIALGTRRTHHINNEMRPEAIPEALEQAIQHIKKLNPNAILRSASNTYNCVGMVFATRRTWVDPEHISIFLNDDGYRRLENINQTELGDVVVYRDNSGEIVHVGIIIEKRVDFSNAETRYKVLSKWGQWAEYIHDPDDVLPTFGHPSEYWTDRKNV